LIYCKNQGHSFSLPRWPTISHLLKEFLFWRCTFRAPHRLTYPPFIAQIFLLGCFPAYPSSKSSQWGVTLSLHNNRCRHFFGCSWYSVSPRFKFYSLGRLFAGLPSTVFPEFSEPVLVWRQRITMVETLNGYLPALRLTSSLLFYKILLFAPCVSRCFPLLFPLRVL